MIPGEIFTQEGETELNTAATGITITIANAGDRTIQVGSPINFMRPTRRCSLTVNNHAACGLDIAAGIAVRFEPGQTRYVQLVPLGGKREVYGFNQK